MQIIAVDIGNSAIKLLAGEHHLRLPHRSAASPTDFADALAEYSASIDDSGPVFWAVVSVNALHARNLEDWIKQNRSSDRFEMIKRDQVPLDIVESYRSSVGIDRLVAACAAVSLQQEEQEAAPIIVVDAGTAVTVDVVSAGPAEGQRRFEGGVIFPGAGPSLSVLNSSTANLPDVSFDASRLGKSDSIDGIVGTQTDMAIANGVSLSQAHAVAGIVVALENRLPGAHVWITGGGSESILELLDDEVACQWNADDQLVLRGAAVIGQQILSSDSVQE